MKILHASCGMEREPLKTAFGFKGSALTCLWQVAVRLETEAYSAVGLGVQSVLWSDAKVFQRYGEEEGNRLMYAVTRYALSLLCAETVREPLWTVQRIFPSVYSYAQKITDMPALSKTFLLNALVPVDMALCQLWLKSQGKSDFDDIWQIPNPLQRTLAEIPLITYGTSAGEMLQLAGSSTPLLKIKIGADPNHNGCVEDMLAWDQERLLMIHSLVKDISTTMTESGHILYYLDANGRYDSVQTVCQLLDFAEKNGILERVLLLEEPFPEEKDISVEELPVIVAADESVHGMAELRRRREQGYRALALKPIAKGISMSAEMAQYALAHGMSCFCADLTVNPLMVTWNQCVAARLPKLPGMRVGVLESNGSQNYANWKTMEQYHPRAESLLSSQKDGAFSLDAAFCRENGGVFDRSEHYWDLSGREVV